jgi:hypothetical protein
MVASALAMILVAVLPFFLAGLFALLVINGTTPASSDGPVENSYQPMRLLKTR